MKNLIQIGAAVVTLLVTLHCQLWLLTSCTSTCLRDSSATANTLSILCMHIHVRSLHNLEETEQVKQQFDKLASGFAQLL